MKLKAIKDGLAERFAASLERLRARIREANTAEPQKSDGWLGTLKPEVRAAFEKALEPIERYRSMIEGTIGSSSRGRNWFPRRATYREIRLPGSETMVLLAPARGYKMDAHGSLLRVIPKRDKSVSARQAKRTRMAAGSVACAA